MENESLYRLVVIQSLLSHEFGTIKCFSILISLPFLSSSSKIQLRFYP